MTIGRARRGAAILALCLGPLTATGCTAFAGEVHPKRTASAAPAAGPGSSKAPVVMFLGDSYTVGERGSKPERTYAMALGRLLGWQVIVGGRGGTGFVAGGDRRSSFIQSFESQLGWRPAPDLLVVAGGHNDYGFPAPEVSGAAQIVLERARQRWPATRVVLIGPLWGNDTPPASALAVRDGLSGLAQRFGLQFIDPIAEHWITGNRVNGTGNAARLIQRDGTHPTPTGHRYVATRLAADFRRLGLAHPSHTGR
ncbi:MULTISPECIES: SGNH/GDSL hydrolase family protein [Thermomonosporaceae]|uniref:SGNH/GDSL hydrolase family protein n=1 Tax=Thermomonosporaceae TaxID=2012 RepID=UPI00255AAC6C|nr:MULTISPECIES: SGNH/GDSL hydrolase family protein [Thermomonosporaceae]MDL4771827.1 SGNH/GDSL hydrolase family protein [Actinomadura xylanilytica]